MILSYESTAFYEGTVPYESKLSAKRFAAKRFAILLIRLVVSGLLLLLGMAQIAQAEDRALIIGIGNYQTSAINLRGPHTDVLLMQDVARRLGFTDNQVLMLRNSEAHYVGILNALDQWLVEGVTREDRVLLFFSGHGQQLLDENGDEADGCDEAWLTYDMQAISDDVLADVLGRSLASNILVIVDSCFSGTMTRSYQPNVEQLRSKTWRSVGSLGCVAQVGEREEQTEQGQLATTNIIELSAAAAGELAYDALAAHQGSIFTQALYEHVVRYDELGLALSFIDLQRLIEDDIARTLRTVGYLPHIPQLAGPSSWLTADVFSFGALEAVPVDHIAVDRVITATRELSRSRLEQDNYLNELFESRQFRVDIQMSTPRYNVNEPVVVQMTSPRDGYVYLFAQTPDGSVYLVFPNQLATNNSIQADVPLNVPGPRAAEFRLYATEPLGQSHLLAVVTNAPLQPIHQAETTSGEILARYTKSDLANLSLWFKTAASTNAEQNAIFVHGAGETSFEVIP